MRASRLLSILILLQLRSRVTAQALADEFEVSLRTIYRDIDELSSAGIPVLSDRGPGGGFQLMPGYKSQFSALENDEAEALFMIGLPGPALALGLSGAATQASRKLMASLPPSLRQGSSRMASCFYLDSNEWYRHQADLPDLPRIARAVLDQFCLSLTYESWSGVRAWQMQPLGLVLKAGAWYLVANSRSRASSPYRIRQFKVQHISALRVESERFERPADFDLAAFWQTAISEFERGLRPLTASLRASPTGLQRIAALGSWAADAVAGLAITAKSGLKTTVRSDANLQANTQISVKTNFTSETDSGTDSGTNAKREPDAGGDGTAPPDWQIIELPIENIEQAALLLLGLGPEVSVLAPAALRQRLGELALQVHALHYKT